MNAFERAVAQYIGKERLIKLQNIRVGVAGAGGLGSNCAFNLVRSGFKRFKIIDFDVIEPTNLNRQFYFIDQLGMPKVEALKVNLLRINPDLELEISHEKINGENAGEVFKDCDVVIEAFDTVSCKKLIIENYYSSGKLLVAASGLAGWGDSDDIRVKKVHSRFFIVGDFVSEVSDNVPPVSPRVNIAAAKQADIVMEYCINNC